MNAADRYDARYHRRWRHARWPDELAALVIVAAPVIAIALMVRQFNKIGDAAAAGLRVALRALPA